MKNKTEFRTEKILEQNQIEEELKSFIREVPDYPKKGILFYDITTLIKNACAFQKTIDALSYMVMEKNFNKILAIESRGFIFGSALAYKLSKGLVLVRKKGKLPYKTMKEIYNLEYGTDEVEMHIDAVKKGDRVLIVDDLLATGGTASASIALVKKLKAEPVACAFIIELLFLKGRNKLKGVPIHSLIKY